jgi:hypothetical protein
LKFGVLQNLRAAPSASKAFLRRIAFAKQKSFVVAEMHLVTICLRL